MNNWLFSVVVLMIVIFSWGFYDDEYNHKKYKKQIDAMYMLLTINATILLIFTLIEYIFNWSL